MKLRHGSLIILVLSLLLGMILPAQAETPAIPTVIETGATETISSMTGVITHDITIRGELIINPGVSLTFGMTTDAEGKPKTYKIIVEAGGRLTIHGDGNTPSIKPEGDTPYDGWDGIWNRGIVTLDRAYLWGAGYGIFQDDPAAVISMSQSKFEYCSTAIKLTAGVLNATNQNHFTNNYFGISLMHAASGSLICGNYFENNGHSLLMQGKNVVNIRNNTFDDGNQVTITLMDLIENQQVIEYADFSQVNISYNNFLHHWNLVDPFYIIKNEAAASLAIYNCYWKNNETLYQSEANVKAAHLVSLESNVFIRGLLTSEATVTSIDEQAPFLQEAGPAKSNYGNVALALVITDEGWGIDPSSLQVTLTSETGTVTVTNPWQATYNNREYTCTTTVNLSPGIYHWSITGTDYAGNSLDTSLLQGENAPELEVSNVSGADLRLPLSDWLCDGKYRLITIPAVSYQLDHKLALGLTAPDSNIVRYQWDASQNSYRYFYYGETNLEPFAPGKAFWIKLSNNEGFEAEQQFAGDPVNTDFSITLKPGWQMIGNPFADFDLPLENISVTYAKSGQVAQEYSLLNAVIDGVVGYGCWSYTNNDYLLETKSLKLWRGYWLYVKQECTLTFHRNQYLPASLSLINWQLQLSVTQAELQSGSSLLGQVWAARRGTDPYDSLKPPSLSNGLKGVLINEAALELGADWRSLNSNRETWHYQVSGLTAGTATLNWQGNIPSNCRLILRDLTTQTTIELNQTTSYQFFADASGSRAFEIVLLDLNSLPPALTNLRATPNPFAPLRESVTISYRLEAQASIEMRIYDWVGNLVYIAPKVTGETGENQLLWNGRNNQGRMVGNGIYYCKLTASNSNAKTTQLIKLAVLN